MNADEQARRVRPRTEPAAADPLPGLSPRGALPGALAPESPRRPRVTLQQLQGWQSDAQPSSPSLGQRAAAGAGPSAAATSPPAMSWSIGSAFDRFEAGGIEAFLQKGDEEAVSRHAPPAEANPPYAAAAAASPTDMSLSLGSEFDRLARGGSLLALLQATGEVTSARSPAATGAAPADALDALRHVPIEGRNTLIAYAAERALSDRPPAARGKARSELIRFGEALMVQQPPIALEALLDHLQSEDPAQRSAAEARKLAYEDAQLDPAGVRHSLNTGIKALNDAPRAQRMLTLAAALQRDIKGRALETLLPEADQPLVQRVRASEREPDSENTQRKLTALCRFGVALMVRGDGGLAAWLQMRQQQPDGLRLAEELRKSIKDGPELNLTHTGKRTFVTATGRLLKYGPGDGSASTSGPQARTDAPTALKPPRSATDPSAAASLPQQAVEAAPTALARPASPQRPASEGPSDLMANALAVEPAMSWSIGSAFDRFAAGGIEAFLQKGDEEAVSRHAPPAEANPPDAAAAAERGPGQRAAAGAGPSAAASSPPAMSWSIGSAFDRFAAGGIEAFLQKGDEEAVSRLTHSAAVTEPARPTSPPAADAPAAPPGAVIDALHDLPAEGCNTLVVYALDRALPGKARGTLSTYRAELSAFGDALLQQQPPVTLEAFITRLTSADPAHSAVAEALKAAYENQQEAPDTTRYRLDACIRALSAAPAEQRMLTLEEALQRKLVARDLKTLMPQAERQLVDAVSTGAGATQAFTKQSDVLLTRLSIVLNAKGHGGLAGWLQMRQQPGNARQADELLARLRNGPELDLSDVNRRRFDKATERLMTHGAVDLGAASAGPSAAMHADEMVPARSPVRTPSPEPAAFATVPDAIAGPADMVDVPPGIPPAGRNLLVVYAADAALTRLTADARGSARSELSRFGEALLQQQPPVTLDMFLGHLQSPDPVERSAAEALKEVYESWQNDLRRTKGALNSCFRALSQLPRSQWMLTPGQALQRKVVTRSLKTLLSEADLSILQRVQTAERRPDGDAAEKNQTALIRFGVALMARGHAGLAAWLQMRNQPDGIRRAAELRDSIKDGPELNLEHDGKRRFAVATGRLVAHGAGDGETTSAPARVAVPEPAAVEVTTEKAVAGPSAAPASPAGSGWSLGSAFERLGGTEGLSTLLQQMDEMADTSVFRPAPRQAGPDSHPATPSEVTGPSRRAPEIVDVDDYPSPHAARPGAAQRLALDPWLGDEDLLRYSQMFLQSFAEELGPHGHARINQVLNIADPQQVRLLIDGDARQREAVLNHLTAPVLFLPVNRVTEGHRSDHWSLLVVDRTAPNARQAYHYDSMVPPQYARVAGLHPAFQDQLGIARQVANALGIAQPMGQPTAQQRDGHSCGDHVLAGIETLARRLVTPQPGASWDLSGLQPSREHIVDTLIRYEQFDAMAHAGQGPQPPRHMEAAPRKP